MDPLDLVPLLRAATDRLIVAASALDDAAVAAPSRLPGWTRGHLLTHLARNADGAVNLLTWARTGVETPQYASLDQRARDIEAGAGRSAAELLADLRTSAARLDDAADQMPEAAWAFVITWANGRAGAAALVPWYRLREMELHHVDLDVGYEPDQWPEAFAVRLAVAVSRDMGDRPDGPRIALRCPEVGHDLPVGADGPVVAGPVRAAAAWLTGRGDGTGLTGPLPAVPPFG